VTDNLSQENILCLLDQTFSDIESDDDKHFYLFYKQKKGILVIVFFLLDINFFS
jgi:hypothetical protein